MTTRDLTKVDWWAKKSAVIQRATNDLRIPLLLLLVFAILPATAQTEPATVRISVLTLFHPKTLVVDNTLVAATASGLSVNGVPSPSFTLPDATFTLTVPHKLTRQYVAALTVTAHSGELLPILTLPTELAVASIVAAEAPPHAPLEALKAQAIASRSFLLANHSHAGLAGIKIDACDTTHCQFLRSPPPARSPASIATLATRGIVLTWTPNPGEPSTILRAMYSRSCGGQTRIPANAGPAAYPFYSVRCDFCLRHPDRAAIYSHGHGIGLCQLGAADLAAHGQSAAQILAHYFPNTTLTTLLN